MNDIDKQKYIICCPLCDNDKCVRGTDKCEAEQWKKEKESEEKGMTLDEAIKYAEEEAKEQDMLCKRYDDASGYTRSGNEKIRTYEAKKCAVCAEEHRMLAWWLRDYKRLKGQEPVLDKIRAEIERHRCKTQSIDAYDLVGDCLNIIDKYRQEG